jgi:hypothetical protein
MTSENTVMTEESILFSGKKEKDWLKNLLHEREVVVEFVKKDGTMRKMTCTLSENKIPSEKMPKNAEKTKNEEILAVFDVENQDWRSFRWDSVKNFKFNIGE